ncbi:MAG: tetratricopeptide repeat protein, partial [Gemmatimonadetes bacterium]|nr:tetratricopeptide repeat protein [Gemmatimonadota bacterium]
EERLPAAPATVAALVRRVLHEPPGIFAGDGDQAGHPATIAALARCHRSLATLGEQHLDLLAARGRRAFEVVRVHRAVAGLLDAGWYDAPMALEAATTDLRDRSRAHAGAAQVLAWKGELRPAAAQYREALQANPRNTDAMAGLAEVHGWLREYRQAKTLYEQILQIDPSHEGAKAKLMQLTWVR